MKCAECGLFARVDSLRVCSACWEVAQEVSNRALQARLRDPEQPPPKCVECGRAETPDEGVADAIASDVEIVSMCALVKRPGTEESVWICSACMFKDDAGEEWKEPRP